MDKCCNLKASQSSVSSTVKSKLFKVLISASLILGLLPISVFGFGNAQAQDDVISDANTTVNSLPEAVNFDDAELAAGSVVYVANKPNDAVTATQLFGRQSSGTTYGEGAAAKAATYISDMFDGDYLIGNLTNAALASHSQLNAWNSNGAIGSTIGGTNYWTSDTSRETRTGLNTRGFRTQNNATQNKYITVSGKATDQTLFDTLDSGGNPTDRESINLGSYAHNSGQTIPDYVIAPGSLIFNSTIARDKEELFSEFEVTGDNRIPAGWQVYNNPFLIHDPANGFYGTKLESRSEHLNFIGKVNVSGWSAQLTLAQMYSSTNPGWSAGEIVLMGVGSGGKLSNDTGFTTVNTGSSSAWKTFYIKAPSSGTSNRYLNVFMFSKYLYHLNTSTTENLTIRGSVPAAEQYGIRALMDANMDNLAFFRENTSGETLTTSSTLGTTPITTTEKGSSYKVVASDSTLSAPTLDQNTTITTKLADGSTGTAKYDPNTGKIRVAPNTKSVTLSVEQLNGNYVSALSTNLDGNKAYSVLANANNSKANVEIDLSNLLKTELSAGETYADLKGNNVTVSLYDEKANAEGFTDQISVDSLNLQFEVGVYDQEIDFTAETKDALLNDTYEYGQTIELQASVTKTPDEIFEFSRSAHDMNEIVASVDSAYLHLDFHSWDIDSMTASIRYTVIKPFDGKELSNIIKLNREQAIDDEDGPTKGFVMLASAEVDSTQVKTKKRSVVLHAVDKHFNSGDKLIDLTSDNSENLLSCTYDGNDDENGLVLFDKLDCVPYGIDIERLDEETTRAAGDIIPVDDEGYILATASTSLWKMTPTVNADDDGFTYFDERYAVATTHNSILSIADSQDDSDGVLRIVADNFQMSLEDYEALTDDDRDDTLIALAAAKAAHYEYAQDGGIADVDMVDGITVADNSIKPEVGEYYPVTFEVKLLKDGEEITAQTSVYARIYDEVSVDDKTNVELGANNFRISIDEAKEVISNTSSGKQADALEKLVYVSNAYAKDIITGKSVDFSSDNSDWSSIVAARGTYPVTFGTVDIEDPDTGVVAFSEVKVNCIVTDKGTEDRNNGERIVANNFQISKEEAAALKNGQSLIVVPDEPEKPGSDTDISVKPVADADDDVSADANLNDAQKEIIRLAKAYACKLDVGNPVAITEVKYDFADCEPGDYDVTFATKAGTSVTVSAQIKDNATENFTNKERIGANDVEYTFAEASEIVNMNAAERDSKLIEDMKAWAYSTLDGQDVEITKVISAIQAQEGAYDVTFATQKGTSITAKAYVGQKPLSPNTGDTFPVYFVIVALIGAALVAVAAFRKSSARPTHMNLP